MWRRHDTPEERAYRRGVGQTLAHTLYRWRENPPASVEDALKQIEDLEKRSLELRYAERDIPMYLDELWPEDQR